MKYQGKTGYYMRPVSGRLFARWLRNNPSLIGGVDSDEEIKLMSCFAGFSNAQTIADILQRPVWAGYSEIDRFTFTNWKLFRPRQ